MRSLTRSAPAILRAPPLGEAPRTQERTPTPPCSEPMPRPQPRPWLPAILSKLLPPARAVWIGTMSGAAFGAMVAASMVEAGAPSCQIPRGFSGVVLIAGEGQVVSERGYGHAVRAGRRPN